MWEAETCIVCAEIDEAAWSVVYSIAIRPFDPTRIGNIAAMVKVCESEPVSLFSFASRKEDAMSNCLLRSGRRCPRAVPGRERRTKMGAKGGANESALQGSYDTCTQKPTNSGITTGRVAGLPAW